jgi:hypothetical protein
MPRTGSPHARRRLSDHLTEPDVDPLPGTATGLDPPPSPPVGATRHRPRSASAGRSRTVSVGQISSAGHRAHHSSSASVAGPRPERHPDLLAVLLDRPACTRAGGPRSIRFGRRMNRVSVGLGCRPPARAGAAGRYGGAGERGRIRLNGPSHQLQRVGIRFSESASDSASQDGPSTPRSPCASHSLRELPFPQVMISREHTTDPLLRFRFSGK